MPSGSADIELNIIAQIQASKIRLRFDKVAVRLITTLQASLVNALPAGQAVILTVTAPIKHPAKTAAEVEAMVTAVGALIEGGRLVHGNTVCVRRLTKSAATMPKVLCFVHNEPSDAEHIICLAETSLSQTCAATSD